jgi:hypothetical protein
MSSSHITIVSGLPRSGTSLMMQMLSAGGLPALTDGLRTPDESNPRGYLEYEPVKKLRSDRSWLPQARGHAVKIIHLLLRELPVDGEFAYRVLLMRRPIEEILASQRVMLERQSKQSGDPAVLAKVYASQLRDVQEWMAQQSCFSVREVEHRRLLESPREEAAGINQFLGGTLDEGAMASCVDPSLYRQRTSES